MLTLITSFALLGAQDQATEQTTDQVADASKDLAAVCSKSKAAPNFSFTFEQEEEGGFGGGGASPVMKGRYKKGSPVEIKQGEDTYYRDGDALIHSVGEDAWEVFDMEAAFGGGGGGDREQMRTMFTLSSTPLPHTVLGEFAGMVGEATKAEKDGKVVYEGELSDKGAEHYSGAQRMRDMASRFGGGAPEMEFSGSFELVASAKGVVEKVVLKTTLSADFGGNPFDRSRTTTIAISKAGETELEVPKGVIACLEL